MDKSWNRAVGIMMVAAVLVCCSTAELAMPATALARGAGMTFSVPAAPQGFSATGFSGSDSALWSSWVARSDAPAPHVAVTIVPTALGLGCTPGVSCRSTDGARWFIYAPDRESLYFELGGVYGDAVLTSGQREYLAHKWGLPHWRWLDTAAAVNAGSEDGLEAIFAQIYQDCALGDDTVGQSYETPSETLPDGTHIYGPSINTGSFDTCAWLRKRER